jgi:hypothetical protein
MKTVAISLKGILRPVATLGSALVVLIFGAQMCQVLRAPVESPVSSFLVNDVSQLNPIRVSEIIEPTTTDEIIDAVRGHPGPIAIGGARHSMGGRLLPTEPFT